MKKHALACFMAFVLTLILAAPALADTSWIPDPGPLMGTTGEYVETRATAAGEYDIYLYEPNMTNNEFAKFTVEYMKRLKGMGFAPGKVDLSDQDTPIVYMMAIPETRDSKTPAAYLICFIKDGEGFLDGASATWWIELDVLTSKTFTLGEGAPEAFTTCIGCLGSGHCQGCGGLGRANYGLGYETCVVCDGSGICNICDGVGRY